MAQAAATRVRPRPRAQPRLRPRAASGIRWDRVGRFGLLAVLGIILLLYVSPLVHWVQQSRTASHERATVRSLQAEHDALQARLSDLHRPGSVEREARRLGMVAPGERPYVVQGVPGGK
jgi:cell division protein FtsB